MNKKCIYKTIKKNYLNEILCKPVLWDIPELHYGIKPNDEERTYTIGDADLLFDIFDKKCLSGIYLEKHLFTKNRQYNNIFDFKLCFTTADDIIGSSIKWKDFKNIKVTYEYQEYDLSSFTFKELIEQLPADEFIDFCKDIVNKE